MKIDLIGVPIKYGCDKDGVQYGPEKLREVNILNILKEKGIEISDRGNIYVEEINENDKFKCDENIKYYNSIYNTNKNLAYKVEESIRDGNFTLILGGDHSIALGSISGVSRCFENIGVVWIDAHGDFNTELTSESKNSHGMPLAFLCGHGKKEFVNLYSENIKLKEKNVFHIGGRDFNVEEEKLLRTSKVNLYDKNTLECKGLKWALEDILRKCKNQNIDALHISLDIDFLDKELVPGTGTRVDGGYRVEEIKYILKEIIQSGLLKSMDFVEFNPLLDKDNKTLDICKDLLEYFGDLIKY